MQKSMQVSLWLTWLVSLCSLSLVLLLTACGDPPAGTSQAVGTSRPTTPHPTVAATPTTDAQFTPNPILVGTGPAARTEPQLAYDKKNGTLVLFGGKSFDGYLQDTWTWDGRIWTQQHSVTSPGPILAASMAYDDATGLIVLFGGSPIGGQHATNETWTWNGAAWARRHPAASPPPRMGASIAYDAAIGQLVLFGGYGTNTKSPLNDTWTWNGTTWTQQHPATTPSARLNPSMAYDAATRTMILFGGDDMGAPIPLLTDTWTWSGTTWTQQHPATSPAVRFTSNGTLYGAYPTPTSMVWDEATQQVLLTLAGSDNAGEQKIQISWTWDGRNWTQQSTQHVPEQEMCVFYRPTQRSVFAFASSIETSTFDDSMWQWSGQAWQPLGA